MTEYIKNSDLELYKEVVVPFGPIGCLVDTRTYRRHLPEQGRRENLLERDKRVINYLLSLVGDRMSEEEKREEALLMLDRFVRLKAWPSSRNKWIGGTSISDIDGTASFNCSSVIVNRVEAFSTAASLLTLGCGVGYRVFQSDIDKLPDLLSRPSLVIDPIIPIDKPYRDELTYSYMKEGILSIFVGDSREGWCEAIRLFIEAHTKQCSRVVINVDSVRPEGERLKRFGGTASGAQALIGMLKDIERILGEREGSRITSIDASDMMCCIAKGVISGSVRRSALICLFDEGDQLMIQCKQNLYSDPSLQYKSYRSQSNNTECIGSLKHEAFVEWLLMAEPSQEEVDLWIKSTCPSRESLVARMKSIENSGEPGMNNYLQMIWKRYQGAKSSRVGDLRSYISGVTTNPCSEIILNAVNYCTGEATSVSTCNLTELGLHRFVKDGVLDMNDLEVSMRLITRIGIYQTCVDMKDKVFDATQKEERLLGVSINGWMDAFNLMGIDPIGEEANSLKRWLRSIANNEADRFSKRLGIPRPLLVTCVKPSGSTSQVLGCSSGIHWQWSPFYVRRVRITTRDPLAQTLLDMGYPAYPEVYDLANWNELYGIARDEWDRMDSWQKIDTFKTLDRDKQRLIIDACNTTVFEFPVSAPKGKTIGEVDVITQLESLLSFSINYTDHMPSCTISVKKGEWESIPDWVIDKWGKGFITASFLSYDDSSYPLLPYEAIEEAEFNKRIQELDDKVIATEQSYYLDIDLDKLSSYEKSLDATEIIEEACVGGSSCPVR